MFNLIFSDSIGVPELTRLDLFGCQVELELAILEVILFKIKFLSQNSVGSCILHAILVSLVHHLQSSKPRNHMVEPVNFFKGPTALEFLANILK